MRVLITPTIYQQNYLTANANVMDAFRWAENWPNTTVYMTLPEKQYVEWEQDDLPDNVIPIESRRYMQDTKYYRRLGKGSWREEQLLDIIDEIESHHGYLDAVIDQNFLGQAELFIFLTKCFDGNYCQVRPFDYIRNIHDARIPGKGLGEHVREHFESKYELFQMTTVDGNWVTAPHDYENAIDAARRWFQFSEIEDIREDALTGLAPIDLDEFDETYRNEPKYVHVAGSTYPKKNRDTVLEVCEKLYQAFGIETIMTSMSEIEEDYAELEFVEAHHNCSYEMYKKNLRRGDIVISATETETMGRTWFEQTASGQVLIAWDREWLYDQIPEDYKLTVGSKKDLVKLAAWAVNNWDEAVAANKDMMEHVREVRSPQVIGEKTYGDLSSRVQERVNDYDLDWDADVIEETAHLLSEPFTISDFNDESEKFTDAGHKIMDIWTYPMTDLILAFRKMGYEDVGHREPKFEKTGKWID